MQLLHMGILKRSINVNVVEVPQQRLPIQLVCW